MKEILTNLIIGIVGGFIGGLLVYFYQKRSEKAENKNSLQNQLATEKKKLPDDFLNFIRIGMNIQKINNLISLPTYTYQIDDRDILVDGLTTNLNSYYFENCALKITHTDNQITSYILQSYSNTSIEFEMPDSDFKKTILGKFAVDSNFEEIKEIIYESNYRESWFGVVMNFGRRGSYYDYCYYGDLLNYNKNYEDLEINDLIGHLITAYGVSSDSRLFRYHSYY